MRLFGCVATTIATAESAASLARAADRVVGGSASRDAASVERRPPARSHCRRRARPNRGRGGYPPTALDFGVSTAGDRQKANNVANQKSHR